MNRFCVFCPVEIIKSLTDARFAFSTQFVSDVIPTESALGYSNRVRYTVSDILPERFCTAHPTDQYADRHRSRSGDRV